jgi:serine/threonine protein kinase
MKAFFVYQETFEPRNFTLRKIVKKLAAKNVNHKDIDYLMALDSQFIVKYYDQFTDSNNSSQRYIVLEYFQVK